MPSLCLYATDAKGIDEHNSHRIQKQKDRKMPQGIPKHLYNFPNHFGIQCVFSY